MPFFRHPAPFRAEDVLSTFNANNYSPGGYGGIQEQGSGPRLTINSKNHLPPHSSHPSLPHLAMLIFEAVLEVVCVSLPGYIVARQGLFTAEMQKFTANLNVALFTPCLIFTKLASQLSADKLVDLAIIPVIFVVQTIISFGCAWAVAKAFGLSRRPRNFVIAMGVFGNSNSLPISLVLSLSKTIKGLHWDKIPHDNDNEVAARGILYLLIFQQLGQLVRWTWGYNVLLAPADQFEDTDEHTSSHIEGGQSRGETQPLLIDVEDEEERSSLDDHDTTESDATKIDNPNEAVRTGSHGSLIDAGESFSGAETPIAYQQRITSDASSISSKTKSKGPLHISKNLSTPANGNMKPSMSRQESPHPALLGSDGDEVSPGIKGYPVRCKEAISRSTQRVRSHIAAFFHTIFTSLPKIVQTVLARVWYRLKRISTGVWEFMNPPLWAMLVAVIVASIPPVQNFFFEPGSFVRNSVTRAIESNAGVAIPLILVVLGGNLAGNTLPQDARSVEDAKIETRLLIASILSRMVLPFALLAPLLAVTAKFIQLSILDDPIFVIVCFLIAGAPSALQLAQICQINNVYMGAMSRLLFQSYVVWILPSTLVLVMTALEVVEWAKR